jgi:hypothetical protein
MAAEAQLEPETQVYHWRRFRFLELGFNRRQAAALAEAQADYHQAATLIAAGCTVDLAFDLLS